MKHLTRYIGFVALSLAWNLMPVHALADPILVPGTRIHMDPPKGFEAARDFPGFAKSDEASSIMVTELPAPVRKLREGFEKEKLASKGLILLERRQVSVDGHHADLLSIRQYHGATPLLKWIACFGTETMSVMLVATFPEAIATTTGAQLKAAILNAKWRPSIEIGIFEGLNFELKGDSDIVPQKQVNRLVLLGRPGEFGVADASKPLMIAGNNQGNAATPETAFAMARSFLMQSNRLLNVRVAQERRTTVAGKEAYEIEGTAEARHDGTALAFYQAVIPSPSGNLMIYGEVGIGERDLYVPRFKSIANTAQFK